MDVMSVLWCQLLSHQCSTHFDGSGVRTPWLSFGYAKIPTAITKMNAKRPFCNLMLHKLLGNPAAIDVKIRIDIPLPTPRSVMSSPSHMTTDVPAVITTIIVMMVCHDVSGIIDKSQPEIRRPGVRATATKPVA